MNTKWSIFGQASSLEELRDLILRKRGILGPVDIEFFLQDRNPLDYLPHFPNEFKIALKQSRDLIERTIAQNIPIVIMGDYDADGVCATSILYNFFSKEKNYTKAFYFIPNRFDHGYGLSRASVDAAITKVKAESSNAEKILFISVDSGITSVDEASYIRNLGHALIITDHHQKPEVLPKAEGIIWSDQIVGTTIAWLLAKLLGSKNTSSLGLVALATVADVYPLLGMNRALVRRGLQIINKTPPLGLKELIQVTGLFGKEVGAYELGWVLGPRINASGRLTEASQAVRLFTEKDAEIRLQIALELNQINQERQDETARMYALLENYKGLEELPRFIFTANNDFHEGIIGLVASRLVREYYRPSIVVSLNGKYGKGSVRSIPGVNIIEILREFDHLFENLGGHPMAAGFTILKDNIPQLETGLKQIFETRFSNELFVPSIEAEAEISLDLVDWPLLKLLEELKPFGEGNPSPRFITKNLKIANINFVGRDKTHTSLKLYDGKKYQKAIFFNSKDYFADLGLGDSIDVIYSVKLNEYNGTRSLDIFIDGIYPIS